MPSSLFLWDERIAVHGTETVTAEGASFLLHYTSATDDTCAVLIVCTATAEGIVRDMRSFVTSIVENVGLTPVFSRQQAETFLRSILPLDGVLGRRFPDYERGIIVLVNGREPGSGRHALQTMMANAGDTVTVLYRLSRQTVPTRRAA